MGECGRSLWTWTVGRVRVQAALWWLLYEIGTECSLNAGSDAVVVEGRSGHLLVGSVAVTVTVGSICILL